jgi:hypothetical protein
MENSRMKMVKSSYLFVVALAAIGVAAAACSGGSKATPDTSLIVTTGTYTQEATSISPNTCGGGNYFSGVTSFTVLAHATSLDITEGSLGGPYSYTVSGTTLTDNDSASASDVDFTDPAVAVSTYGFSKAYDCKIHKASVFTGTVTAHDKFTLVDDYSIAVTSGIQCAAVATTSSLFIPCEDAISVSMKK